MYPNLSYYSFQLCVFILNLSFISNASVKPELPTYTEAEKNALVKFRELVKSDIYRDYMSSDMYLIRWLRAKNFDQNEAHKMLEKTMQWRKSKKIDGILNEIIYAPPKKPWFADGTDPRGSLVSTLFVSRIDTRSLIVQGKREAAVRYFGQLLETAEQKHLLNSGVIGNKTASGPEAHLGIVIVDVIGYNLRQHGCLACFGVYMEWFQMLENYYPGYVKHLIFINVPRIFGPMLEFLKPLMSKSYRNGMQVIRQNKAEWQNAIGKLVPFTELPRELGGTKTK